MFVTFNTEKPDIFSFIKFYFYFGVNHFVLFQGWKSKLAVVLKRNYCLNGIPIKVSSYFEKKNREKLLKNNKD